MAEREHADAFGLRHAAKIGDRNTRNAVDRVATVELKGVDDQMEAIRQVLRGFCHFCFNTLYCCGHSAFSLSFLGMDGIVASAVRREGLVRLEQLVETGR